MANGVKYRGINKDGLYVFQASYYLNGKRLWKTFELANKSFREAADKRQELRMEARKAMPQRNGVKLDSCLEVLMEELKRKMAADKCCHKTINRALSEMRHFLNFLRLNYPDVQRIDDFPHGIFSQYQSYVIETLGREKGWRTALQVLKANMARFYDAGFFGEAVMKDLRKMKPPRMLDLPYEPISRDEKQNLLAYMEEDNPAYGGILYFLIRLGWRPAETISIRIKNIRFKDLIPVSIKIEAGDRKNRREFIFSSLDKGLREVIMRLYDPEAEYLFRNSVGNKVGYNHYNLYLRKVSKEIIGREVTAKLFRKSVVTELLDEGIAPKNVMGVTGHRDIKVLLRHYSHQTDPGTTKALKLTEV